MPYVMGNKPWFRDTVHQCQLRGYGSYNETTTHDNSTVFCIIGTIRSISLHLPGEG